MRQRLVLAVGFMSALACASARPPGTFMDGGPFHANILRLNAGGTFSYEAWSDDGGMFWSAEGTWQWVDGDRFVTEVTNISRGSQTEAGPLHRQEVWRVTRGGVTRGETLFRRQRLAP